VAITASDLDVSEFFGRDSGSVELFPRVAQDDQRVVRARPRVSQRVRTSSRPVIAFITFPVQTSVELVVTSSPAFRTEWVAASVSEWTSLRPLAHARSYDRGLRSKMSRALRLRPTSQFLRYWFANSAGG
jgi:hypothetical protein